MIPAEAIEGHLLRLEIEDFLWYEVAPRRTRAATADGKE
jgi:hypothetical protein